MPQLALFLFGAPRLERDGVPVRVQRRKVMALLVYLAVTGKSHARDTLATIFWPDDDPSSALAALRRTLSELRGIAGAKLIRADRDTVNWVGNSDFYLDVLEFRRRLEDVRSHPHALAQACSECMTSLAEAVQLYRADFLAGFSLKAGSTGFDEWLCLETESLRRELADVLKQLALIHQAHGEAVPAILFTRRWLTLDPTDETAHQLLMRLYAASGQRSAALRQYHECAQILGFELGISPTEETIELYERICLKEDWSQLLISTGGIQQKTDSTLRTNNLPIQFTSFIGRETEIAQIKDLFAQHRLVTLTGLGGVGKTRLSIQAAGEMLADFPDGVWYVELAHISDPELVLQTVVAALGLLEDPNRSMLEILSYFISSRELLLVLDNCEHLIESCAHLCSAILHNCPEVAILATSREALGIEGERAFHVPSLPTPERDQALELAAVRQYAAVQLFEERAGAALPGFQLTNENLTAVAQVCARLDGIPLAIELAAARVKLLRVQEIAQRLDDRFHLLTRGSRSALPRQQTLRASIDWSYQLLSEPEKILLRRLAVFAGGSTLEIIEAICAGEGMEAELILELLSGLVNKSIVIAERRQHEEARYRMLETVRQYAREKLSDSGELERQRNLQLEFYVAFCEEAYLHIHGAGRIEWTRRLKSEYANIREALEWAFQDSTLALQGLRIATALTDRFWVNQGLAEEGTNWLNTGLLVAGENLPKLMQARVYYCLSKVGAKPELSIEASEKSIALCREIGAAADEVLCSALIINPSNFQKSLAKAKEAVQIARRLKPANPWVLGGALLYYADVLSRHPQRILDDQAYAAAEESLQVHQSGDRWACAGLWIMGVIQTWRGQSEQAQQLFFQALELLREVEDKGGIHLALVMLAWFHRRTGNYRQSLQWCQEMHQAAKSAAHQDAFYTWVYSIGLLQASILNGPVSIWDPTAGMEAVQLYAFTQKSENNGVMRFISFMRTLEEDQHMIELLREKLGEAIYTKAWKEGQAMTLEQAVSLALEVLEPSTL
jgi:predicted ATPase